MKTFDIYIAHVSWDEGAKTRPVLIIERQESVVFVFNITTQYESKSETVRAKYFKINDWQQAGLNRPSYVNTNVIRDLPATMFDGKTEIGRLTITDELRLIEFML